MEITKEKYDLIMKLLKDQEEKIKLLELELHTKLPDVVEFSKNVANAINITMLDDINVSYIVLAILEIANKDKSLDIASIKQKFILNIEKNNEFFGKLPDINMANDVIEKYINFFETLEETQKIYDKIDIKNVKTSGNTSSKTTKKIMNKDYENMKNDNIKSADENTATATATVTTNADEVKKSSNIIHIDFKGDKN